MSKWVLSEVNLRKVYDYCIRRGMQIDKTLGSSDISNLNSLYSAITQMTKNPAKPYLNCINEIKSYNAKNPDEDKRNRIEGVLTGVESTLSGNASFSETKKAVREIKRCIISIKDCFISDLFAKYCQRTNSLNNAWTITRKKSRDFKDVFSLSDGCGYLYCRIIQESIKHNYGICVGNRTRIIRQLKGLLLDDLPKAIIRTDIKSFFETINTEKLLADLENDNKLPKSQINSIRFIIDEYHKQANQTRGLPRGIGVSSYLAEKYLLNIDDIIKRKDNVIYYARFVDDIVIITTEKNYNSTQNADYVYEELKKQIKSVNLELHSKESKTTICSFFAMDFDYLGYHFFFDNTKIAVDISQSKMEIMKAKINRTIVSFFNKEFSLKNGLTYRKKLRILKDRLELLSRPVHLLGMPKKIVIGTPITYSEVTRDNSFIDLDRILRTITSSIPDKNIQSIVNAISFSNKRSNITKDVGYKYYKYLTAIWRIK